MYPQNSNELIAYLRQYPEVRAKFPHQETTWKFKGDDPFRMIFTTQDEFDVIYPVSSFADVYYNEDGFIRSIGPMCSYFFYTGPMPWKLPNPHKQDMEDWDSVFAGLKNFAD